MSFIKSTKGAAADEKLSGEDLCRHMLKKIDHLKT